MDSFVSAKDEIWFQARVPSHFKRSILITFGSEVRIIPDPLHNIKLRIKIIIQVSSMLEIDTPTPATCFQFSFASWIFYRIEQWCCHQIYSEKLQMYFSEARNITCLPIWRCSDDASIDIRHGIWPIFTHLGITWCHGERRYETKPIWKACKFTLPLGCWSCA